MLTTVLNYHDEVRLHSRMIGALLDPNNQHYQGTLFLKIFLQQIGLENWFENLEDVEVGIEYQDIDLYLSDGEKHLIIENKIWAGDQPCQIIKYINIIVEENKEKLDNPLENSTLDKNTLRVVYLTPRAKKVSSGHQLETLNGDQYISFKDTESLKQCSHKMKKRNTIDFDLRNYKASYKKITYKQHIKEWLTLCQEQVEHISNLYESIEQYKNVVLTIHNDYKKNVIDFIDYIRHNTEAENLTKLLFDILPNDLEQMHQKHPTIKTEILNTKTEMLYRFFRDFEMILELDNVNYEVSKENNKKLIYSKQKCKKWFHTDLNKKQYRNFGTFYKLNNEYLLYIFIGKSNYHFGIVKHDNFKILDITESNTVDDLEFRSFKSISLKWFSKNFRLEDHLEIFYDFENSTFYKMLKQLLEKYNNVTIE